MCPYSQFHLLSDSIEQAWTALSNLPTKQAISQMRADLPVLLTCSNCSIQWNPLNGASRPGGNEANIFADGDDSLDNS